MPLEAFRFENIDQIEDGVIAAAVNRAIRAAWLDCADRPEVTAKRKIGVTLNFAPVQERGQLVYVDVSFGIKETTPEKSIQVRMRAEHDGLEFSPTQSHNPDQKDIPFPKEEA